MRRSTGTIAFVVGLWIVTGAVDATENPVRLTRSYDSKFFPRVSPDGTQIAYARHHANRRGANRVLMELRIVGIDGTKDRPLLAKYEATVQVQEHPCWSADGRRLWFSGGGNDLGNASKDIFYCELDGQFQAAGVRKLKPGARISFGEEPSVSPDGKRIAYVTPAEELWLVGADGVNQKMVLRTSGSYLHQPAWSPDGRWIAFTSDQAGNVEIYKIRPDGTELTRLTREDSLDSRPRWSRDSRWILFTSNRTGNYDLFAMRSDGTEAIQLTAHESADDNADWLPDGRAVIYVSMRDGGFDFYRISLPKEIDVGPAAKPASSDEPGSTDDSAGGLVAHYDFDRIDEGRPNRVVDRTGHAALDLVGSTIIRKKHRGAASFDGLADYAVGGNPPALQFDGSMTASLWVRPNGITANGYVISKYGWNLYLGSDGIAHFETRTAADDAWQTVHAKHPVAPGKWSQIAIVFDKKARKLGLYVDGRLSAEAPRTDGSLGGTAAYPLELGRYNVGRSQFYRGQIDEVRISRRALSAAEIAREFAAQRPLVSD